jgi:choline dehydrogenase-like flavoprotein
MIDAAAGKLPDDSFDLILVGTGFASTFFLREFLRRSSATSRVLVLERGKRFTHAEYLRQTNELHRRSLDEANVPRRGSKTWNYLLAFGGGSNCWWANTPRMTPADFETRTRFGVGDDWPISYNELEPYYCEAEDAMGVAGPNEHAICPRSRPYPQPMHRMSDADRLLERAYPGEFFGMPSARARVATAGRPVCCNNGICSHCPVDAKFTVENELAAVYDDPRVTLALEARGDLVETAGGIATGVVYTRDGVERRARGELIALGANGFFNPHLLLRSGIDLPAIGKGLVEQVGLYVVAYLNGVENFQGSTSRCGHGYMLHRDQDRAARAPALVLTHNTHDISGLRQTRGKWKQILGLSLVFEDLRQDQNRVELDPANPTRPNIIFNGRSAYAEAALERIDDLVAQLLAPLPIDGYEIRPVKSTEAHIIGTTVMGTDPVTSVIDRSLLCHTVRNLVVLGSGAFPTAAPANPTLTIAALSLRAADQILPARRETRA